MQRYCLKERLGVVLSLPPLFFPFGSIRHAPLTSDVSHEFNYSHIRAESTPDGPCGMQMRQMRQSNSVQTVSIKWPKVENAR